jgi:hypothetical protein
VAALAAEGTCERRKEFFGSPLAFSYRLSALSFQFWLSDFAFQIADFRFEIVLCKDLLFSLFAFGF